jgi:hypothetical protein
MGAYNTVFVETAVLAGLCLVAVVVCRGKVDWGWLLGALVLFAVHKAIIFLGVVGLTPDLIPGRYNWEGKALGVFMLLIAGYVIFRGDMRAWGFTLSQNGPAPVAGISVAALTAIATAAFMYFYFPGVKSEPLADWTYQLTMPSLDEEFLDRGILLVMLERAFHKAFPKGWFAIGLAAVITTLMFYLSHAMSVGTDWSIAVVWLDIVSLITGALFVYVRIATGSVLLPVLLHSWFNTAGYIL